MSIVSDSTHPETTTLFEDSEDSESYGPLRWMSPELLDPAQLGAKNGRPTKESDCYALGMVVLEVLTGKVPFSHCSNLLVMRKIIEGEHPDRPTGPEAVWFTDDLWAVLEQCWLHEPERRPTIKGVLECLEQGSVTWEPLVLTTDGDSQVDDDDSVSATSLYVLTLGQVNGWLTGFSGTARFQCGNAWSIALSRRMNVSP